MALTEWKNEKSFTSCEDCGSWMDGECKMGLAPKRAGFNKAGDIYDCKNFHLAKKPSVEGDAVFTAKGDDVVFEAENTCEGTIANDAETESPKAEEKVVAKKPSVKKSKNKKK
jgi:hypothetical protein